jgi:transposase
VRMSAPMHRFVGIDIGSRKHYVAIVDLSQTVILKPTAITEDAAGYDKLFALLGSPDDTLIVLETTGHYWKNLFAALCARRFQVAVVNPLRTHRYAQEDLRRAKTDLTDAVGLARFAAQKHPPPTPPPDPELDNLRELVHLQDRLGQDLGDRVRQIHRLVDFVFPEFTRLVRGLDSQRASALLRHYPSAKAFQQSEPHQLARLRYDGRHTIGAALAGSLQQAARISVAQHHSPAYESALRVLCADLDGLRDKLRRVTADIRSSIEGIPLATLLTSIDGLGPLTVAHLLARLGDPSRFRSCSALAAYVGVVPGTNQSGLHQPSRAPISPLGNAALRAQLWMPTLAAVKCNDWLRPYYERLIARGKPPKLALVAAMRKLLTAIYAVAKNRQPFVPRIPHKS